MASQAREAEMGEDGRPATTSPPSTPAYNSLTGFLASCARNIAASTTRAFVPSSCSSSAAGSTPDSSEGSSGSPCTSNRSSRDASTAAFHPADFIDYNEDDFTSPTSGRLKSVTPRKRSAGLEPGGYLVAHNGHDDDCSFYECCSWQDGPSLEEEKAVDGTCAVKQNIDEKDDVQLEQEQRMDRQEISKRQRNEGEAKKFCTLVADTRAHPAAMLRSWYRHGEESSGEDKRSHQNEEEAQGNKNEGAEQQVRAFTDEICQSRTQGTPSDKHQVEVQEKKVEKCLETVTAVSVSCLARSENHNRDVADFNVGKRVADGPKGHQELRRERGHNVTSVVNESVRCSAGRTSYPNEPDKRMDRNEVLSQAGDSIRVFADDSHRKGEAPKPSKILQSSMTATATSMQSKLRPKKMTRAEDEQHAMSASTSVPTSGKQMKSTSALTSKLMPTPASASASALEPVSAEAGSTSESALTTSEKAGSRTEKIKEGRPLARESDDDPQTETNGHGRHAKLAVVRVAPALRLPLTPPSESSFTEQLTMKVVPCAAPTKIGPHRTAQKIAISRMPPDPPQKTREIAKTELSALAAVWKASQARPCSLVTLVAAQLAPTSLRALSSALFTAVELTDGWTSNSRARLKENFGTNEDFLLLTDKMACACEEIRAACKTPKGADVAQLGREKQVSWIRNIISAAAGGILKGRHWSFEGKTGFVAAGGSSARLAEPTAQTLQVGSAKPSSALEAELKVCPRAAQSKGNDDHDDLAAPGAIPSADPTAPALSACCGGDGNRIKPSTSTGSVATRCSCLFAGKSMPSRVQLELAIILLNAPFKREMGFRRDIVRIPTLPCVCWTHAGILASEAWVQSPQTKPQDWGRRGVKLEKRIRHRLQQQKQLLIGHFEEWEYRKWLDRIFAIKEKRGEWKERCRERKVRSDEGSCYIGDGFKESARAPKISRKVGFITSTINSNMLTESSLKRRAEIVRQDSLEATLQRSELVLQRTKRAIAEGNNIIFMSNEIIRRTLHHQKQWHNLEVHRRARMRKLQPSAALTDGSSFTSVVHLSQEQQRRCKSEPSSAGEPTLSSLCPSNARMSGHGDVARKRGQSHTVPRRDDSNIKSGGDRETVFRAPAFSFSYDTRKGVVGNARTHQSATSRCDRQGEMNSIVGERVSVSGEAIKATSSPAGTLRRGLKTPADTPSSSDYVAPSLEDERSRERTSIVSSTGHSHTQRLVSPPVPRPNVSMDVEAAATEVKERATARKGVRNEESAKMEPAVCTTTAGAVEVTAKAKTEVETKAEAKAEAEFGMSSSDSLEIVYIEGAFGDGDTQVSSTSSSSDPDELREQILLLAELLEDPPAPTPKPKPIAGGAGAGAETQIAALSTSTSIVSTPAASSTVNTSQRMSTPLSSIPASPSLQGVCAAANVVPLKVEGLRIARTANDDTDPCKLQPESRKPGQPSTPRAPMPVNTPVATTIPKKTSASDASVAPLATQAAASKKPCDRQECDTNIRINDWTLSKLEPGRTRSLQGSSSSARPLMTISAAVAGALATPGATTAPHAIQATTPLSGAGTRGTAPKLSDDAARASPIPAADVSAVSKIIATTRYREPAATEPANVGSSTTADPPRHSTLPSTYAGSPKPASTTVTVSKSAVPVASSCPSAPSAPVDAAVKKKVAFSPASDTVDKTVTLTTPPEAGAGMAAHHRVPTTTHEQQQTRSRAQKAPLVHDDSCAPKGQPPLARVVDATTADAKKITDVVDASIGLAGVEVRASSDHKGTSSRPQSTRHRLNGSVKSHGTTEVGNRVGGNTVSNTPFRPTRVTLAVPPARQMNWIGRATSGTGVLSWGNWKRGRDPEAWEKMVAAAILRYPTKHCSDEAG